VRGKNRGRPYRQLRTLLKLRSMDKVHKNLLVDLTVIIVSIFFAIWLSSSGLIESTLSFFSGSVIIGSLIAGLFFTSIFTAAPAIVMLASLAQTYSSWEVALFAGFGAVIGDLLMFGFLKERLARDFYALFNIDMTLVRSIQFLRFRWVLTTVAILAIASPFPDELGLAILGFSNSRVWVVVVAGFVFHFLGIITFLAIIA
jgi:hypothetical protein